MIINLEAKRTDTLDKLYYKLSVELEKKFLWFNYTKKINSPLEYLKYWANCFGLNLTEDEIKWLYYSEVGGFTVFKSINNDIAIVLTNEDMLLEGNFVLYTTKLDDKLKFPLRGEENLTSHIELLDEETIKGYAETLFKDFNNKVLNVIRNDVEIEIGIL